MGNGITAPGIMRDPARMRGPEIPHVLPHEKVFPIQIGSKLFRLSGASISSDGMYYIISVLFYHVLGSLFAVENGWKMVMDVWTRQTWLYCSSSW